MAERLGDFFRKIGEALSKKKGPEAKVVIVGQGRPEAQRQVPAEAKHAVGGGQKDKPKAKETSRAEAAPAAPPATAAKAEVPTEQQALRDRLQKQAMAEHKLPYEKLSVGAKLKLLNEQLREQPDPKAAALKAKLEKLQDLQWDKPNPEQWQEVQKEFVDMPKVYDVEEPGRAALREVQLQVFNHVASEENLPRYGLKVEDRNEIAEKLGKPEFWGATAPAPGAAPEWWEVPRGATVRFFDESAPRHTVSINEAKEVLKDIDARIQANSLLLTDIRELGSLGKKIEDVVGKVNSPQIIAELRPYIDDIERLAIIRFGEERMEREFATFYLPRTTKKRLHQNAKEEIYTRISRVEESTRVFEGDTPESAAERDLLRKSMDYIVSPDFEEDVSSYIKRLGSTNGWGQQQIDDTIRDRLSEKSILSERVSIRSLAEKAKAFYLLTDFDHYKSACAEVGMGGLNYLFSEHSGLVQDAFFLHDAVVGTSIYRPGSNDTRRMEAERFGDAWRQAADEMWNRQEEYQQRFQDEHGRPMTEKDCREIMALARKVSILMEREPFHMIRGAAPQEDPDKHSFTGFDMPEGIAKNMRFIGFGLEREAKLSPGRLLHLEAISRHLSWAYGLDAYVDRRIAEAKTEQEFVELCHEVFNVPHMTDTWRKAPNPAAAREKAIKIKLKGIFKFDENGNKARKAPKSFEEIYRNRKFRRLFRDKFRVREGVRMFEQDLMMYELTGSGPYAQSVLDQTEAQYTFYGELATGIRLRYAGADYLAIDNPKEQRDFWDENIRPLLEDATKRNPHEVFRFHFERRYKPVMEMFQEKTTQDLIKQAFPGISIQSEADLYSVLSRYVVAIENGVRIENRNNPTSSRRLDYSADYSATTLTAVQAKQKEIAKKACGVVGRSIGITSDTHQEFLKLMRHISGFVSREPHVVALRGPEYFDIYRRTQWLYDIWLEELEHPDKFGDRPIADRKKLKPLSERMGAPRMNERGVVTRGDLLPRKVGDNKTGDSARGLVEQMLGNEDWKELAKLGHDLKVTATDIYGPPWNARIAMDIFAGAGELGVMDPEIEYTFVFGGLKPRSSKWRRGVSEDSPAVTVNEMHKIHSGWEIALDGQLKYLDHRLARSIKVRSGLAWAIGENKEFEGKLWLKRIYGVAAISLLFVAAEAAREAQESFTGAPPSGGGGG